LLFTGAGTAAIVTAGAVYKRYKPVKSGPTRPKNRANQTKNKIKKYNVVQ
jgi:hypothetical protein